MSFYVQNNPQEVILVLTPNHSANWRLIYLFLLASGGITLAIAVLWAALGAWLILPFAGLEIVLLSYFLWRVASQAHSQQTVHIQSHQVLVRTGLYHPQKQWCLNKAASQFVLDHIPAQDTVLVSLVDHANQVEIGQLLNPEDKSALVGWINQQTHIPHINSQCVLRKM